MTNNIYKYFILAALVILPVIAGAEEDVVLGRVNLRNGIRVDNQAKKEIASIAAKIKKIRKPGAVKIRGDFPSALNADEYMEKSVFMAREVEDHLKKLLPLKQQIFILTSKFTGEKRGGQNLVELFFYPNELVQGDIKTFRSTDIQSTDLQPKEAEQEEQIPSVEQVVQPVLREPVKSEEAVAPRVIETGTKKQIQQEEDPDLANELVNKAKARAAERAKRRNSAE